MTCHYSSNNDLLGILTVSKGNGEIFIEIYENNNAILTNCAPLNVGVISAVDLTKFLKI